MTAKIKRSFKAGAIVALVGVGALSLAHPLIKFSETDAPIDAVAPAYVDMEAEKTAMAVPAASDSELEDRAARPVENHLKVSSGDTLMDVLVRAGVETADANQAIEALRDVYNPRALKAGQRVTITFDRPAHGLGIGGFTKVSLNADPLREVLAHRTDDGGFSALEAKRQVSREIGHYSGVIKSSLFESAQAAGIPAPIIIAMIKALSYDVDFQRDIQSGDTFDVMYEAFYDTKGKLVRVGDMLYAAVNLGGRPIAMYRYEAEGGVVEYFNEKGESIKKALLKTPVDGARITSGFGVRNHPILGFTKMHKGIDFGVPTGTPIQAAGDGVIEMAGPYSSYGNYVRIRHSNNYATAYAHMSRIAPGMRNGKRVTQGQIIGFVGSTGRATGPHLHYEVLVGANQVNPLSVKMPTNVKLAGRELNRFNLSKRETDQLLAKIAPSTRVAANSVKLGALTN